MFRSLKLLIIIIFFVYSKINLSSSNENSPGCAWKNNTLPCLEIIKQIPNSSKFTKKGITKFTITKKQIEDSGAVDLIDALNLAPSLNITQSGPKGQQASVFMRGTGSNHVLVMINGVPINDQSTTQGLHDFGVDFIQTVEQIEIYPGSSATHFGTNAIGGAINLILTNDYKDNVFLAHDKDDNYEISANKAFIFNNSSLNIKFGSVNNETISARGSANDEPDNVENYTANINFEKYLNPQLRIFSTSYIRQTIAEYDGSNTNQIGYEGDNRMATIHFGINDTGKEKKQNSVFYYNLYDREYDEKGVIDEYKSEVIGLKYDLSRIINNNLSFGLGTEYKYDWGYFNNKGSYSASTKGNIDNLSLYSNLGIDLFPKTNFSINLRNDRHKQTGNNSSYKINLNQTVGNFNFGFSRMTGIRNPTLYELFGTDNFGYSGNKNLRAEKSTTNEFYTKYFINEKLSFLSTFFKSSKNNNIEYVSNKYINDSDNIDLNQSGFNGKLNLKIKNANVDLYTSLVKSYKEDGSLQLRRPKNSYGVNISKKINNMILKDYILGASYNHYGKHFDTHSTNFSTIKMDSTDLINIKLSKKVYESEIFLKISNLLDETFQRPHGYNQDGRIIKFGLKY